MNLLYVTSSFPYGHGEGFLAGELAELRAQGHRVTVVPTFARGPVVHEDARPFLACTRRAGLLSPSVVAAGAGELRVDGSAVGRQLASLRRSRNASVLAKNLAAFPKALWTATVVRELDVEHVHAHWGATSATVAMIAAELAGVPWSLTVHRWDIREDNLLRRKAQSATFVRAISADGLSDLRRRIGDTATPTFVLHMGVSLPPSKVEPAADGPLRVLVPANLLDVKGHRHLVDAVALLGTRGVAVRAELAGQGPLRAAIDEQITGLRLDGSCVLLGQLPHEELQRRLAAGAWDTVVMPSVETPSGEKEGIPVALLEAMSHGLPVVGTRAGGVPELLDDGSGLLVPSADPVALADALEQLAGDPGLRRSLGAAGRARVERDFASSVVVRELAARIREATPRPR